MKKAFLCHSSVDKNYVDIVAKKLGRAKILYDKLSFAPGQDFRSEILKHLDKASLFVFFASANSLRSTWCKFELQEAEFRLVGGGIEGHLTIIIDRSVTHADLPKWMQFTKAVLQPRQSQASRDVEAALYSLLPEMFKAPFVGRAGQISEFVQIFSTRRPTPQILILTGLDGVGRRTYLERSCKDNLGLTLGPFFLYDETKRLEDVYLWLFNETDDLTTRSEIRDELASFSRLSLNEQLFEINRRLEMLCRDNNIPCFVDYGGLLSDPGEYRPPIAELLRKFVKPDTDRYVALVHQRSPRIKETEFVERSFQQTIPPLDENETRLLVQQLLRRENIAARDDQISELVGYLGGYPPAAYLAAMHAKAYGFDVLMADKSVLTDFQAKRFTGLINKLKLSDKEWFVLRYLSAELIVPLSVVALAADVELADAAIKLRNLIEQSLVVVVNDQYGLSAPIRNAIERVKGNLDTADYKPICERLTAEFWQGEHAAPSIEIVDATLHAAARTGSVDLRPYSDLIRVSTIHRLALECYYRREWQNGLKYIERAVAMDPNSYELLELHFKTLVRLERYSEAKTKLGEIQATGSRNFYYLEGFFHRFQRHHKEAVESFSKAEAGGNRSQALLRDYADCLHRLGRDKEALAKIEIARNREPADIFVLDLYIKICLSTRNVPEAEKALLELERYDTEKKFIHHRRATILAEKRSLDSALREAEIAFDSGKGTFEAHCQKIDILIELGRYDQIEAELDSLKRTFGNIRKDVQTGLRCKLFIRQRDWRHAQAAWDSLEDKDAGISNAMLRQILIVKSEDESLPISEREAARDEIALLDPDLRDLGALQRY